MSSTKEPTAETPRPFGPVRAAASSRTPTRTRELVTAALVAALLAASAWIAIPLGGGVPLTLQTFIVVLAGLVLTPRAAAWAVGTYLLLGAAGVPVFAGVRGGLGVLAGPTGGYLWGFLVAAVVIAVVRTRWSSRAGEVVAVGAGVVAIYALGWAQLVVVAGMTPVAALLAGVAPFIAIDAAKAVVAYGVAVALRRAGVGV